MIFLFDTERTLLAEIGLREGGLRQIVLTAAGETRLGAHISNWQTRGIPVMHSIEADKADGSHEVATYFQYVQPREGSFQKALQAWAMQRGFCPVEISDRLLGLWESLVRLPLLPSERFAILLAIRLSPPETLAEWKSCLDEAEYAWRREHNKKRVALDKIKNRMGKQLAQPFSS